MTDHTIVLYDSDKSPADLVAEAIALCERQIAEWHRTVTFLGGSKDKHAENQLNSWLTHKAEFEEHDKVYDNGGIDYEPSWSCVYDNCYETTGKNTPCDLTVTKAKRLLGVSE